MALEEENKPRQLRSEAEDVTRFRDYADADADWFWELDPNYRFAIVSMRREGRSSVREFDLLGKTPWEFADADPDQDHEWAAFFDNLQRRAPFRNFRIAFRQEGGGLVHWRLSGKPVLGADGMFFGYRGIATDETVDAIRRSHLETLTADYQAALEALNEGVAYFDDRQRLSFSNPAFRGLLPLPAELFQVGTAYSHIIDCLAPLIEEDRRKGSQIKRPFGRGLINWKFHDGRRLNGEMRLLPSGRHILTLHEFYESDSDGELPQGSGGLLYDELAQSWQPFIAHVDERIVFANRSAAEIFSCNINDMLGREMWDFIHPDDQPRLRQFNQDRREGASAPETYTALARRSNGEALKLEFFVHVGEWDGARAVQVFLHDRTVEDFATTSLINSEQKFRDLVNGSIQGLFVHREWKILYANETAANIFGYDVDDFIGRSVIDLIAPDERGVIADIRRRRLAGDEDVPERYEFAGICSDGSSVAVEIFSRLVDWDGEPAIQATMMDISRRREAERYLVQAKEAAEKADRTKTEFLGNMSHELRTPLNAIIGFSQLIRDKIMGEVEPHYVDYAGSIHASGLHLLEVVNDLLDVASIESGAMVLNEDDVQLSVVIRSCERMLRPRAQKAEQLISVDYPDKGIVVRGDSRRLKQILINLVNNSIKFTHAGGHIVIRNFINNEEDVVLEVEDSGIGISEADQKVIFDAFTRVDSAFVSEREGTGLGLPLVHALTELHGGWINLKSVPDKGTTISVVLPKDRLIKSA